MDRFLDNFMQQLSMTLSWITAFQRCRFKVKVTVAIFEKLCHCSGAFISGPILRYRRISFVDGQNLLRKDLVVQGSKV